MSLTGGTGDVNPQWFKMYQACGAEITNNTRTAIPVQRLQSKKLALVMEILKIQYIVRKGDGETQHCHVGISTIAPPNQSTVKPDNSMGYIIDAMHISPANAIVQGVIMKDLTDGAGHGVLVATDFIYPFGYSTKASTTDAAFDIWLLYRWKAVGLEEYSGMLQAQSN